MRPARCASTARSGTLTSHQFELLCALADNAGRVLSRDQLMNNVRGVPLETFDRSIDTHISRIRAAIEDDPRHPEAGHHRARRRLRLRPAPGRGAGV